MRSRYVAYTQCNAEHLLRTWHPHFRPQTVDFDPRQRWLGLKVKTHSAGARDDEEGTVEFVARYKIDGRGHRLHEISRFSKLENVWFYLDGTFKS